MPNVYGLVGYPLDHSFSKKYFENKFIAEGILDTDYKMFSISKIKEIENIFLLDNLKGFNVTIPYKKAILPYLHNVENIPTGVNACNCVKIIDNLLWGYNTDVLGFENSFLPLLKPYHTKALILGNGGASEAAKYVCSKHNIDYKIVSRKLSSGVHLTYNSLTENDLKEYRILINTTPVGSFPNMNDCVPIPYHAITSNHLLYDMIYNPTVTQFLKKGEQQGATIQNGYNMLVAQAEASWQIWNG